MRKRFTHLLFSGLIVSILCLFPNRLLYAAEDRASQTTAANMDLDLIILLTAFSSLRETVPPDKLSKAFAYLTKPYRREKVKEVLHQSIIWASEAD